MLRDLPARDGRSGFALVESGLDALVTLYDLAATAERSLDLQYYLWRRDAAGRLLMSVLLDAADRGVRVRILLDGWESHRRGAENAALISHPRFAVRLFHPPLDRPL